MPPQFPGFPPEARQFLRRLKTHNTREWFQAHKEIYDHKIKTPMAELVLVLGEALREIAPELDTDPKKAMYRIYRDVRFSRDKSPYKTQVAAKFGPRGVGKYMGGGTYFHFSGDEVLVGGGIYAPGPQELLAVRQYIAEHDEEYRRITAGKKFRRVFKEVEGEKLKRMPKGFPADHPAADLLLYKQFLVFTYLPAEIVETPKFAKEVLKHFELMLPFLRFLNRPLLSRRMLSGPDRALQASRRSRARRPRPE
jgi:uncharacterized protein (TIGR02453 family)